MKAIVAPIRPDETGDAVANLQDALHRLIGHVVIRSSDTSPTADELTTLGEQLVEERRITTYGRATQRLVQIVQLQQDVGDNLNGVVESQTAEKINELLKALGVFDDSAPDGFVVRGTITTFDGQPLPGAVVRAFDRDMRGNQLLAEDKTRDRGEFQLTYGAAKFARGDLSKATGPWLIVQAFVGDEQIGADVIRKPAGRDEVVDFTTAVPIVPDWEKLAIIPQLLEGQGADGQPVQPWELIARDIDFIAEDTLLDREQIRLWALAYALGRELVTATRPAGEGLTEAITAEGPRETDQLPDFACIIYAWFQQGLSTEASVLWATPNATKTSALNAAVAQHIVPPETVAHLDGVIAAIEKIKLEHILAAPAPDTSTSLAALLTTLGTPPDQQRVIAGVVDDLHPDDPRLTEKIGGITGFVGDAPALARTLRLGAMTGGHVPLVRALQAKISGDSVGSLAALTQLKPYEWIDLAHIHGIPDGVTITHAAYADGLAATVERQYPTASLAAHLREGWRLGQHPALADVGTFLAANPNFDIVTANLNAVIATANLDGIPEERHKPLVEAAQALQRLNGIGASLGETAALMENDLWSPHQIFTAGPDQLAARLEGRIDADRVTTLYNQTRKLHNVTFAAMTAGLSPLSAPRIMPTSRLGFPTGDGGDPAEGGGEIAPLVPDLLTNAGEPDSRDSVGELATGISRTIEQLDPNNYRVLKQAGIPAADPLLDVGAWIDHQPALQSLFGSQDSCACGQCGSVLSPSAYYVDVLQFIRHAGLYDSSLEYSLLKRRPDLQDIELSCNNTYTEMLAIDAALEILENAVALPLKVDLPADTNVIDQLSGPNVGPAVRDALKKTVRTLPDTVRATQEGAEWTVVDGHRRWKLTAQLEDGLRSDGKLVPPVNDLAALQKALNQPVVEVPLDAQAMFAALFAPNQQTKSAPAYSEYDVTITPEAGGNSWRVGYQLKQHLTVDLAVPALTLQTFDAVPTWHEPLAPATVAALATDLSAGNVPLLVKSLLETKFSDTRGLVVQPAHAGDPATWVVVSARRELRLRFIPAQLNITSLTYQSGDARFDAIAEPENHNPEAYVKLNAAIFPWSLPLDLPLDEVRLFLERANSSRRTLIELTAPVDKPLRDSPVLAREVLGLSGAEADLITTKKSEPGVYDNWGIPPDRKTIFDAGSGIYRSSATPLDALRNVSILLQQSRLSFVELQAALVTRFVRGSGEPLTIQPTTICKPSEMSLELTPWHLDRLHRFIRLWRKLGWTMREVDLAIQAFGDEEFADYFELTPNTLVGIARLQRLKELLGLSVAVLIGGIHRLETQSWTDYLAEGPSVQLSLYARIFQREDGRSVDDVAALAVQDDGNELKVEVDRGISAHASYIGACLGITATALTDWVSGKDGLDGLGITDLLNLANLSRLTAATGLCRALSIPPEMFAAHLKLFGPPTFPFQSGVSANDRAEATLQFIERFQKVRQAGIEVEMLRYVLQHSLTPGSNVDIDAKKLNDLAAAARAAMLAIPDAQETAPPLASMGPEALAATLAANAAAEKMVDIAREDAAITALATGFGAERELVDSLLRDQLHNPSSPNEKAIGVFPSSLGDFTDLPSLIKKLRMPPDTEVVSRYLWNQFSLTERAVLSNSALTPLQQKDTVVAALNQILLGPSIYETVHSAGVQISREAQDLNASPRLARDQIIRLNRLLLEDSYPSEISKRRLPDIMLFAYGEVSQPPSVEVTLILVRLHKALLLCDALRFSRLDIPLMRKSAADASGFTVLDFNRLPVQPGDSAADIGDFERLLALSRLRNVGASADLLINYSGLLFTNDVNTAWSADPANQILMTGLALSNGEVAAAANQIGIITGDQYRDPIVLGRLLDLLAAVKQLGVTLAKVVPAVGNSVSVPNGLTNASPNARDAETLRDLLRGKYGDSRWHDLIKPAADQFRTRQRDALMDYLAARYSLRSADDLYEYFLIDVQTGSCLKTTRLLMATAAAQLYVQRVLLNLETGATLGERQRGEWEWKQNYRVWEANRKVFLFPENWLLPELRDDKTSTFGVLEGALTQQEPSAESTHDALLGYIEELSDLARISVIAMYQDFPTGGSSKQGTSTLYVVGRTPDPPYRYFWRSCDRFGDQGMTWSGWEALDLDNANDFIMPFVFEGDLHLAWPIFQKTKDEKDDRNRLWWQVQIAWTRRTKKGWIKRKLGLAKLDRVLRLPNKDELGSFSFRITKVVSPLAFADALHPLNKETIRIECFAAHETSPTPATLYPDPALLKDAVPIGIADVANGRWNVELLLTGLIYEYAIIDSEGTTFSRPLPNVSATLYYDQKASANQTNSLQAQDSSNSNGIISIRLYAQKYLQDLENNGNMGILNGSKIRMTLSNTLNPPNFPTKVDLPNKTFGTPDSGYSKHWTWDFSYGVRNDALGDLFKADRSVDYQSAGVFIIESGTDLRCAPASLAVDIPFMSQLWLPQAGQSLSLGASIDGNRFIARFPRGLAPLLQGSFRGAYSGSDFFSLPTETSADLLMTLACRSPVPADWHGGTPWYIQYEDRGYYIQRDAVSGQIRSWSDGQPFAASYRIVAAISDTALFESANESRLHFDTEANNFQRPNPYANYNWEIFLHAPLALSDYLASQQRFADARLWLHAVFDPTRPISGGLPQFWRFLEFDNTRQPEAIASILTWLANPGSTSRDDLTLAIAAWEANPFMPHLIARMRPSAYQWYTFFAYLDVLIGWGDQLFRRDTRESVNEATLLYVLAAKLLGPRPRVVPAPTPPYALTYRLLLGNLNGIHDLDESWVDYANLPGVKQLSDQQSGSGRASQSFAMQKAPDETSEQRPIPVGSPRSGTGLVTSLSALDFCVPQNEKLTELYDRVENRLFNVRNCRSIDGVFRDLPLYDPPIDPLLLIRARNAGLEIGSVLDNLSSPLPNYRFSFMLQKAIELCAELKALGSALMAALEKKDSEYLTLLRTGQEVAMLKLARDTRQKQIDEADTNIAALQKSAETTLERFGQYQKLLGKPSISIDQDGLPVVEQSSSLSVATDPVGTASGLGLSDKEVVQLVLSAVAHNFTQASNSGNVVAGFLALIPNLQVGSPFASSIFGGTFLGNAASATAKAIELGAAEANYYANLMGTVGGYERRQDEWLHQSRLALAELKQIQKQTLAAEIRKDIAQRELDHHDTQIESAEAVNEFLHGKFTNQELYRWMSSQLFNIYSATYQLALDQARRVERAYQRELSIADNGTAFVRAGNWDSVKQGLLAGELLHLDLKRMESAFLERNVREFEITKHVSMRQLNPVALLSLRVTGSCTMTIPEWVYDREFPGHYMRRIKTVSLSIPSVVGPYTGINYALTLTSSDVRVSPLLKDGVYASGQDDSRMIHYLGSAADVIVTSTGINDSGLFETNLRDERFLPFEGAGAISTWSLSLPGTLRPFDYSTISDVILHVRYTARSAGPVLGDAAIGELVGMLDKQASLGQALLFCLRQDFATEWSAFVNGTGAFEFALGRQHFPYFIPNTAKLTADRITLYAANSETPPKPNELVTVVITPPAGALSALSISAGTGEALALLSLPFDANVLKREQPRLVYMVVEYHFGDH